MPRTAEIWKPIRGYTGLYEISNRGRVRSLPHKTKTAKGSRTYTGRILKVSQVGPNTYSVNLCKKGTYISRTIATLLRKAFPS